MRCYVVGQLWWMIGVTVELATAMGVGARWMFMLVRLLLFVSMTFLYFLPMMYWYLFSPTVIRRVPYRSSRKTKLRNVGMLFKRASESMKEVRRMEFGDSLTMEEVVSKETIKKLGDPCVTPLGTRSHDRTAPAEGVVHVFRSPHCASVPRAGEPRDSQGESLGSSSLCGGGDSDMALAESTWSAWCDRSPSEDSDGSEDEEDKQNLHNRARLDIYLPMSPDSLFSLMGDKRCRDSGVEKKKFPIVICISGGAWIVGCYLWSGFVARLLADHGYAVFCPDYRNFPQTDMEGMVADVSDAIAWVVHNAERYNGDLSNVTLVGQSAGAHLSLMSLLSQARVHAHEAAGEPLPGGIVHNVNRYNPRVSINRYIGLSGIYDLLGLVPHFDGRGLYRKVLYSIAGGEARLASFSPSAYFCSHTAGEAQEPLPENIFDFLPRHIYFLHGDADESAPVSESADIAFAMRKKQQLLSWRRYGKEGRRGWSPSSPSSSAASYSPFHQGVHCSSSFVVSNDEGAADGCGDTKVAVVESKSKPDGGRCRVPEAEIRWVKIPGASHTDPIVDEVLVGRKSSLVEFIFQQEKYLASGWKWETEVDSNECGDDEGGSRMTASPLCERSGESTPVVTPMMLPDAILPLCVPYESRPLLMRAASYVCPF